MTFKKFITALLLLFCLNFLAAETLPPLINNKAPHSFEELWSQFDPQKEPLETEIIKEWEEENIILKIVRYRIGIFKGQKAMMAAVYGYPKGAKKLPGLVQIHGGGQYASHQAVLTNAKRGYATLSISWAGRISSPKYHVSPKEVKAYWSGDKKDPAYRITTEWGPLDGYHAPCRNHKNNFASTKPEPWTLDSVDSPRNNSWFLITLGARRGLTFLERQTQVDPNKLGVYGHSMGGKLTVMTTGSDSRVKAAAPSCGGMSDLKGDSKFYQDMICDDNYLKRIECPIIFLSPSNDFHGTIDDLQTAVSTIKSKEWRVTCSPHHNHQDTAEYEVATQLWFDQYLKNSFKAPETPSTEIILATSSGIPQMTIMPDTSKEILEIDIYYTQQGQDDGQKDNMINTKNRFWHHAQAKVVNGKWTVDLPLYSTDKPLWVYANVTYPLKQTISGAGYYYGTYTTNRFTLSSKMTMVSADQLKHSKVKSSLKRTNMIEDFGNNWQKQWYSYRAGQWPRNTHKIYHPMWKAPKDAKLSLEVKASHANKITIGLDSYAAEAQIQGKDKWQKIILKKSDFINAAGDPLTSWNNLKELRLGHRETLRDRKLKLSKTLGAQWQGPQPSFRNLQWLK